MLNYRLASVCYVASRIAGRASLACKRVQEWCSENARRYTSAHIEERYGYSLDDAKAWDVARRERALREGWGTQP